MALKYKQLWTVEAIFRTIESQLDTRPIYADLQGIRLPPEGSWVDWTSTFWMYYTAHPSIGPSNHNAMLIVTNDISVANKSAAAHISSKPYRCARMG